MNLLLFVMTMLMLLVLMTYARLETFRSTSGFQLQFLQNMQREDMAYYNEMAEYLYNVMPATKKETEIQGEEKVEKTKASSQLPLFTLIDKQGREQQQERYIQQREILKRLMIILYSKQQFFQEMEQKKPNLIDEIINHIIDTANQLPEKIKIKNRKDLTNLDLDDKELNELFYKMLKGNMPDIAPKNGEELSPQVYPPLLDYITVSDRPQVRVYLAPKPLLVALFQDQSLVNQIIEQRNSFYNQLKNIKNNDKLYAQRLSVAFREQFSGKASSPIDDRLLDFTVTKTNPKDYENLYDKKNFIKGNSF